MSHLLNSRQPTSAKAEPVSPLLSPMQPVWDHWREEAQKCCENEVKRYLYSQNCNPQDIKEIQNYTLEKLLALVEKGTAPSCGKKGRAPSYTALAITIAKRRMWSVWAAENLYEEFKSNYAYEQSLELSEKEDWMKALWEAIAELPSEDAELLLMKGGDKKRWKEISEYFGRTEDVLQKKYNKICLYVRAQFELNINQIKQ